MTTTIQQHPNLFQKTVLLEFWDKFGGRSNNGKGFSKSEKVAELKRLSAVVIPYSKQTTSSTRREQFDEAKSKLHKMGIERNSHCFCCGAKPNCRHHIILLKNGGINSRKNLVSLCDGCHVEIHPWLSKSVPTWRVEPVQETA